MVRLLAVVMAMLVMTLSASGQSLYRRVGSMSCNETYTGDITGRSFQSGMLVSVEVDEWRRLSDDAFRTKVLNAAFNENLLYCRSKNIAAGLAAVIVRRGYNVVLVAWVSSSDQGQWRISIDRIDEQVRREDAIEARKREDAAREAARLEAVRKAEEARRIAIPLPDYDVDHHCRTSAKNSGLPNPAALAIRCIEVQQAAYDRLKGLWSQAEPAGQHDCRESNDRPAWQRALLGGAWPYESLLHCIAGKLREAQSAKELEGRKFKK